MSRQDSRREPSWGDDPGSSPGQGPQAARRGTCTPQVFGQKRSRNESRADRLEPVLMMEAGENGFRHDPMAVRQSVVNRP
jgi:hypothetical protein